MNRFTREDFENPPMQMRGARPFWAYVAERANSILEKWEKEKTCPCHCGVCCECKKDEK